jgi:hypothetical protein
MSKISELSDGGVIQGGDTLIAVRSGGNVKVTYGGTTTANIDGGTIDGTTIGGTTPAAGSFTTGSFTGDVSFGDNDKTIFGAGSDLKIYHDGSDSYIDDTGTGRLRIRGAADIVLAHPTNGETYATFSANGANTFYYDNAAKLATSATGIDVTGTVTADTLDIDSVKIISGQSTTPTNDASALIYRASGHSDYANGDLIIQARSSASRDIYMLTGTTTPVNRLQVNGNGNISFYEDTGTTAKFFWDSSAESLGIGTSAPSGQLDIVKGSAAVVPTLNLERNTYNYIQFDAAGGASPEAWVGIVQGGNNDFTIANRTAADIAFQTNSTERMRINSSGYVGIGTASPSARLEIKDGDNTFGTSFVLSQSYNSAYSSIASNFGGTMTIDAGVGAGTPNIIFRTNGTERMRIDSSGNLLVGATSTASGPGGIMLRPNVSNGSAIIDLDRTSTTATSEAFLVRNGGSVVGKITYNNTSTSYVTSSDYRLKENVVPLTGATERVKQLNPTRFNFIADADTTVDGFLAHEVADVVPEAITGTKDGMRDEEYEVTPAVYEDVVIPAVLDEEGNEVEAERTEQQLVSEAVMGTRSVPDYQGIDQSKLVPLLVATIQELEARITALESN